MIARAQRAFSSPHTTRATHRRRMPTRTTSEIMTAPSLRPSGDRPSDAMRRKSESAPQTPAERSSGDRFVGLPPLPGNGSCSHERPRCPNDARAARAARASGAEDGAS